MDVVSPAESVLVELLDHHGRVHLRQRVALSPETRSFSVGRAVTADVPLDDAHAAALHAMVEVTPEGRILVSDLDSLNGVVVAGTRHHGRRNVEVPNGQLQIGRTRLRIRTAHEALAPEKPDHQLHASWLHDPKWIAGIAALVCVAQIAYWTWLGAPRDLATPIVTALFSVFALVGVWVAMWTLLTRVILGEWRGLRHTAIALGVLAVFTALSGVLDVAWFALSLPPWPRLTAWTGATAFACVLYLHLTHASHASPRRAAIAACVVPALLLGVSQWSIERGQRQNVNFIDAGLRIYPPALRLRAAGTVDDYFQRAATLRDAADELRKTMDADDDGELTDIE
jgi:pSer/pThr/pTyr-binding forkhead associated (FHA) protein